MRMFFVLLLTSFCLTASAAQPATPAPNLAGTWQGTLPGSTPQGVMVVVHILRTSSGDWNATMFIANADPIPVDSVTVDGAKIELIGYASRFDGVISADGNLLYGAWIHGNPRPLSYPWPVELRRSTRKTAWTLPADPGPHTTRYVTVDKNVNLEVLDWGGTGRPVVLLAGLGGTAHTFDQFAPKLTSNYHVYGITPRGFGNSSTPFTGYNADRLGDDVLAVLDALHLNRPILVGHSIAGEELSSVGSRFPQRVAGLIYLDAGYLYAYYDGSKGDRVVDLDEMQRRLDQIKQLGSSPANLSVMIQEMLDTELPRMTQDFQGWQSDLHEAPSASPAPESATPPARLPGVGDDIDDGFQRYTSIPVPVLAIFAIPHEIPTSLTNDPATRAAWDARDEASSGAQARAFEKGVPRAHVVWLPHANHDVFRSNEADVLREMETFIGGLPK